MVLLDHFVSNGKSTLADCQRSVGFDLPGPQRLSASYILPIAARTCQARRLSGYLTRLSRLVDDVIVVDGSSNDVFEAHAKAWSGLVRHIRPAMRSTNGKVAGVMTGIHAARHDRVIIADDDVRFRQREISLVLDWLENHAVVRPQNFFVPLPWHGRWDTGRTLLNRCFGGDWPGTLGVRRSALLGVGGYSGEVLFENFELVRIIRTGGGKEAVPLDLFVARRPPTIRHFWSQRVRQAYDEFARPKLMALELAVLPIAVIGGLTSPASLVAALVGVVIAAEVGRRRGGGGDVFATTASVWSIAWVAERSISIWMALITRFLFGGVRYGATRIKYAATPRTAMRNFVPSQTPYPSAGRFY